MKTTVELPGGLLEEAKRFAARQGVTLKQIMEVGPRQVIAAQKPWKSFRLEKHTVGGKGFAEDLGWSEIREHTHEGRGG